MIHLEMHKDNERAKVFYRRCGFRPLCPRGDDLYLGLQATIPKPGHPLPGAIADIFAYGVCVWVWKEAHLRTGEPYDAKLVEQATDLSPNCSKGSQRRPWQGKGP